MKTLTTLLIAVAFSFSMASAQVAPIIEWQNTIGGSDWDELFSAEQTSDGGYILGGTSKSDISGDKTETTLYYDYWVVKLDTTGSIEWQNTIGGNDEDWLYTIHQTTDGGYILGGYSNSGISGDKTEESQGGIDYWVVKLNSAGTIVWQNTIGGNSSDFLYSIQQTSDGGYILGGASGSGINGDKTEEAMGGSDYWVVKLDSAGTIEWQNTIAANSTDDLYSIQQTTDGGYILGGYSVSNSSGDKTEPSQGMYDYWVVKLDSAGTIEWQNVIGGSQHDYFRSIQQTTDGGYILGGYSFSGISGDKTEASQGSTDFWVVKLDNAGTIEWQNAIGGSGGEGLCSIQQTTDGGYIVGGDSGSGISGDKTEESPGGADYWIVKLNSAGTIEWQNTIGGNAEDGLYSVQQTMDGGYILGGYSFSGISGDKTEVSQGGYYDYWVVKLTAECDSNWYFADADGDSFGNSSVFTCGELAGYIADDTDCDDTNPNVNPVASEINNNSIDDDCDGYIDEFGTEVSVIDGGAFPLSVFPNPTNNNVTIKITTSQQQSLSIKIIDLTGRELYSENIGNITGIFSKQLDLSNFSPGTYLLQFTHEGQHGVKKLILLN